jgi:glyoxylase-like metal-dependent hydrolase (beta-lactamase superfamily II)
VLARPKESSPLGRLLMRASKPTFEPFEPGPALHDGEVLPVAGGLRVVHTPGHSPGHVALLHEPSGVLVTGDSIFNVLRLRLSPKSLCADFQLTRQTAHRLGELDYDVAAFTHGTEIRDNAREQVRGFLRAVR